jgi:hypothetical protein
MAGCGDAMGCSDLNVSVLTVGGSKVDVYTIATNMTSSELGGVGNTTHLHLYGLLGEGLHTATALPSRLEESDAATTAAAEVTADGTVVGEGDDSPTADAEDAAASARGEMCSSSPMGDDGEVCERLDSSDMEERAAQAAARKAEAEAAATEAAVQAAERKAATTFRERHLSDSDPPLASLSNPVRCYDPSGLTLPPSTGDGASTVVHCSQPRNGKCVFTMAYSYRPPPDTPEDSDAWKRWLAHLAEQEAIVPIPAHARSPDWSRVATMSVEEAAAAAKEVEEAEQEEARAVRRAEAARSPECARFREVSGSVPGDEASERRGVLAGLPGGASDVVEVRPGCIGRGDCGDWEVSAALTGQFEGVSGDGKLEVWASSLSGFQNFTSTGVHPFRVVDVRPFAQCVSASTEDGTWPRMASITDGGVFWVFTCAEPPHGSDSCTVSYVLKRL